MAWHLAIIKYHFTIFPSSPAPLFFSICRASYFALESDVVKNKINCDLPM